LEGSKWQAEQMKELVEIANSILTLTHPELSNVEMNTLTTRQYMLWQQALKRYRGDE
jgi:hypothetical protein